MTDRKFEPNEQLIIKDEMGKRRVASYVTQVKRGEMTLVLAKFFSELPRSPLDKARENPATIKEYEVAVPIENVRKMPAGPAVKNVAEQSAF